MSDNTERTQQPQDGDGGAAPPASASQRVMAFLSSNKVAAAMWFTRLFTVACAILFILPLFGGNPYSFYQRCLISSAATSALRLHQRLPNFQLSREFFGRMFMEDSAHYLFFSLMFATSYPITLAVIPVTLFALLHATSYTRNVLDEVGPNSMMFIRNLINKLTTHQNNILRFIASCEIFLMPIIIFMIFFGHASLFLPFVYYRFLSLRYASQRNPYCRQIFAELRYTAIHLVGKPQCPQLVANIVYKSIAFIERLAPQTVQQPPAQ